MSSFVLEPVAISGNPHLLGKEPPKASKYRRKLLMAIPMLVVLITTLYASKSMEIKCFGVLNLLLIDFLAQLDSLSKTRRLDVSVDPLLKIKNVLPIDETNRITN